MVFKIRFDRNAPSMRNPVLSDIGPMELSSDSREKILSGETVDSFQQNDVVLDEIAPATIDHEADIIVEGIPAELSRSMVSLDESILIVDQIGKVSRVSDGTAGVLVRAGLIGRRIDVSVSRKEKSSTSRFNSWVTGSLGKALAESVDSRIDGKTPATHQPLWSVRDHDKPEYQRNADCWASDIFSGLSAVSVWNSQSGERRTVTAITARHCVGTPHHNYIPAPGSVVRFVTPSGEIVEREVVERVYPPGYEQPFSHPDIGVCLLDSDLPDSIPPVPIVPVNWKNHLFAIGYGRPPCLALNRSGDAMVKEFAYSTLNRHGIEHPFQSDQRQAFSPSLESGDSGNPIFLIHNDSLNLLSLWSTAWGGPRVSLNKSLINDLIVTAESNAGIATGYSIQEADWSNFPEF